MWYLLLANTTFAYSRADSLRGGNGNGRNWWDVQKYELNITFDTATRSISGTNLLFVKKRGDYDSLQIDLQEPMMIDSVICRGRKVEFVREGNVYWLLKPFVNRNPRVTEQFASYDAFVVYFHGRPREAVKPPWDGGVIWGRDSMGNAWHSVACQGLGASVWWPCKDQQSDEPDQGMNITLNAPAKFTVVSNGRLLTGPKEEANDTRTWTWSVKNPINSYDVSFYLGDYIHWQDTFAGEKGTLDLSFYALSYNREKAEKHFAVTKEMLRCFEHWMGPYPFYEDGYKLVEAPFLGMEHQSAIAYGNLYQMGYMGRDRSKTGVGMSFDFIIIHESGHEWYGNNITAADIADNWIHEGFTTYSETLFAGWILDKASAYRYVKGERENILNNIPVVAPYGVHGHGSGDMYDKGANLVHMIRVLMNDDEKFRSMLRDMNKNYYHAIVTGAGIEEFIINYTGLRLEPLFNQYLRTTQVPELEYHIKNGQLHYRFNHAVEGFSLPLVATAGKVQQTITVTPKWQSVKWPHGYNITFSDDFYYFVKQ
ncbi:MAG: M1 family metallopeptidase [Flavipsychrobacter sp.]|nr:M1 family metallopeptidase [Flavipsychrobacter sp.]